MTSQAMSGLKPDQMQVPSGTGPDAWRSKHPLLASLYRCKGSMETSLNLKIKSKSVIMSSLVTRSRFSEMSDQWRMSIYMFMSKNVM